MQSYSNPSASRNQVVAAGAPTKAINPVRQQVPVAHKGTATGKGMINEKVSVPVPGTNKTQATDGGGVKHSPKGFQGGMISGKI